MLVNANLALVLLEVQELFSRLDRRGIDARVSRMHPERWQQIDQLFHSALAREPNDRAVFIAEACSGDESLRSEIEALISSHEQAESFIETSASDLAAELLAQGQAGISVGQSSTPAISVASPRQATTRG